MPAANFWRRVQPGMHVPEIDDRTLHDIGLTRLDLWVVAEDTPALYPIVGLSLGTGGFVAATLEVLSIFVRGPSAWRRRTRPRGAPSGEARLRRTPESGARRWARDVSTGTVRRADRGWGDRHPTPGLHIPKVAGAAKERPFDHPP